MTDSSLFVPQFVEEVTDGLTLQWFYDKRLVVYRLTSVSGDVLNIWADTALRIIENTPPGQPYLAVHELSHRGIGLGYSVKVQYNLLNLGVTAAGRERVELFLNQHPEFDAAVALVFSPTFSGNLGQTFARYNLLSQLNLEYKIYFTLEQAMTWLTEKLASHDAQGE